MKKLVILSKESVFSGYVKCGNAELADSLANSLSENYEVTLIVANGQSRLPYIAGQVIEMEPGVLYTRLSKVDYYIINIDLWLSKSVELINSIHPDIFHNLDDINIIKSLSFKPDKSILTFDYIEDIENNIDISIYYDNINTHSETYANMLLRRRDANSTILTTSNFTGIAPGILTDFFDPSKGLLIPSKYDSSNLDGKKICKQYLANLYGLQDNPFICLTMCRLVKQKGLDTIIEQIPFIKEQGGILIVVGRGDADYERILSQYKFSDGVIYVPHWASYAQIPQFLAGADFYLQPSLIESGGLMPLTAMSYGTIPIVTLNGGLLDNFNDDNAIVVYEDNGLKDAIARAAELYNDKQAFTDKRIYCMQQDISWNSRKENYIALYES